MEYSTVNTLQEAEKFFLKNHDKGCFCVHELNGCTQKQFCETYPDAERFFREAPQKAEAMTSTKQS